MNIIKGTWQNKEHDLALLTVEDNGEQYPYGCSKYDNAQVNIQLWDMIQSDGSMIEDSDELKMALNKMPIPEGYKLIENFLVSEEEEKEKIIENINAQLDALYSGRVLARAERNKIYADKRQEKIDILAESLERLQND
jgi:hypothetical protein